MAGGDRDKALDAALANIERQFGKGSVMRLGDETRAPLEVIPTGSIALDVALGVEHLFVLPSCAQAGVDTRFSTGGEPRRVVVGGGS